MLSFRVVEMAPSCSQSDPQKTPETTEEKRKHRNKCDRECHAAETAEHKEHRLNKCRMKDRARHAAHAAAKVVLHSCTPLKGVWPCETTAETPEQREIRRVCMHATCTCSAYPSYINAKARTNQIDCCSSSFHVTACSGLHHNARHSASVYIVLFQGLLQIQCCCYWV